MLDVLCGEAYTCHLRVHHTKATTRNCRSLVEPSLGFFRKQKGGSAMEVLGLTIWQKD
jgi:hypothetical protein